MKKIIQGVGVSIIALSAIFSLSAGMVNAQWATTPTPVCPVGQTCPVPPTPVTPYPLTITSPILGAVWQTGTQQIMRWTGYNDPHVPKIIVVLDKTDGSNPINISDQQDGYFPYLGSYTIGTDFGGVKVNVPNTPEFIRDVIEETTRNGKAEYQILLMAVDDTPSDFYDNKVMGAVVVSVTTSSAPTPCYTFSLNLGTTLENDAAEVEKLQKFLIFHGYVIENIDSGWGIFGQKTADAVKLYQGDKGLPITGFVGPITRGLMSADCGNPVPQPVQFPFSVCETAPLIRPQVVAPNDQYGCEGKKGVILEGSSVVIRWFSDSKDNDYQGFVINNANYLGKTLQVNGSTSIKNDGDLLVAFDCNKDGLFEDAANMRVNEIFDFINIRSFVKESCSGNADILLLQNSPGYRITISDIKIDSVNIPVSDPTVRVTSSTLDLILGNSSSVTTQSKTKDAANPFIIQKEALLLASFTLSVYGGSSGVNIYKDVADIYYFDQDGKNANANSRATISLNSDAKLKTMTDQNGMTMYLVPAKQTVVFKAKGSIDPKQMFAGNYYATLKTISANPYATKENRMFYLSPQENKTKPKMIAGEKSPYITSLSGPVKPGEILTVKGQRLNDTTISIDGITQKVNAKVTVDGKTLSFVVPKLSNGQHVLVLNNKTNGASNRGYFEVQGISSITVTNPTDGESLEVGFQYKIVWTTASLAKGTLFDITEYNSNGKSLVAEGLTPETASCTAVKFIGKGGPLYTCSVGWTPQHPSVKSGLSVSKRSTYEIGYSGTFTIREKISNSPEITFINKNIEILSSDIKETAAASFKFKVSAGQDELFISKHNISDMVEIMFAGTNIGHSKNMTFTSYEMSPRDTLDAYVIEEGESRTFFLEAIIEPTRGSGQYRAQATYLVNDNAKGGENMNFGSEFVTDYVALRGSVTDTKPSLTLTVAPSTVTAGQAATLTWSSSNMTSCSAWDSWLGDKSTSGSQSTGPLTSPLGEKYTMTCKGSNGSVTKEVKVAVTGSQSVPVTVLPLTASTDTVAAGSTFVYNLNWSGGPLANTTPDEWQIFVAFVPESGGSQIPTTNFFPSFPVSTWSGYRSIGKAVAIPSDQAPGIYKVLVGMFHSSDQVRAVLSPGPGVTENIDRTYVVGKITVVKPTVSSTSAVWDALKAMFGF